MSEGNLTSTFRGFLWAIAGAVIALVAVYAIGIPGRPPAAAPQPAALPGVQAEKNDGLRERLAALEQEVAADRKRLAESVQRTEAERARLEQERASVSAPASSAAKLASAQSRPAARPARDKVEVARVETRASAPAVPTPAPVAVPAAPSPAVVAPPAQPKVVSTPADVLASAERFTARGSYSEAAAALKPLAEQDNAKAQLRLGELYLEGQGVERNEQEGARLVRKAASLGDSEAQLKLGEMYFRGRGVPQNNFQAYVWYNAAVRSGNAAANAPQERVAALLQPVEVEQAAKLAARLAAPQKGR